MHSELNVLHSCPIWLPTTQKWMYNMISNLPDRVENVILCDKTKNLDAFPYKNIYSKKEMFIPFAIEEGLKRLGIVNSSFLLKRTLARTKPAFCTPISEIGPGKIQTFKSGIILNRLLIFMGMMWA